MLLRRSSMVKKQRPPPIAKSVRLEALAGSANLTSRRGDPPARGTDQIDARPSASWLLKYRVSLSSPNSTSSALALSNVLPAHRRLDSPGTLATRLPPRRRANTRENDHSATRKLSKLRRGALQERSNGRFRHDGSRTRHERARDPQRDQRMPTTAHRATIQERLPETTSRSPAPAAHRRAAGRRCLETWSAMNGTPGTAHPAIDPARTRLGDPSSGVRQVHH